MVKIKVTYHKESETFIGDDGSGNTVVYKADRENNDAIPSSSSGTLGPMTSLLMACGACSGIDIVMIMEKQRAAFEQLEITVTGLRAKDQVPALWQTVHIDFNLTGNALEEKAQKAAALSVEKYCSVLETLRRAGAAVTFQVITH